MQRPCLPLVCLFALIPGLASGQSILDAKQPFVGGLIQLIAGVRGNFGDERSPVTASLGAMETALSAWDASIQEYRTAVERQLQGAPPAATAAGMHVALGAVYLDRGHIDAAVDEFTVAATLDPARADIHRFRALAYEIADKSANAAADFRAAWTLDSTDPANAYLFLLHAPTSDQPATDQSSERERALTFLSAFQRRRAAEGQAEITAPFLRVTLLDEARGADPFLPPAIYAAAFRRLNERRYEDALTAFRQAWAADPLNTDPALASAAVQEAIASLKNGQVDVALSRLDTYVRQFGDSSEARRLSGTAYWLDDQYEKSIEQLRAAIALNPLNERARMTLADVHVSSRHPSEAEHVLREAIEAIPSSGQAHWGLARVFQMLHRDADARRELETAMTFGPLAGAGRVLASIARSYLNEADLDAAARVSRAWVAADPNDAAAHETLGQVYWKQNRESEALAEFAVEALIDPNAASAHAAIGQIHLAAGRYAEAVEASGRALVRNPGQREARYALAIALLRLGDESRGRQELAAAQQLQAEDLGRLRESYATNLLRIEAALREQQGKFDDAASLWRQVTERTPAAASDLLSLADALSKAGRHAEAIAAFREVAKLPVQPDVYRSIIKEYLVLGRTEEADAAGAAYQQLKKERLLKLVAER